jgi:glycogen operon protein
MMNMFWEPLVFEVPVVPGRSWRIAIETFAANPDDLPVPGRETSLPDSSCTVRERSIVVLVNR